MIPIKEVVIPQIKHILSAKSGKMLAEILIEWKKIVGTDLNHACYPVKIKSYFERRTKKNVLYVHAINTHLAFQIDYKKETILERIALHFGFKCIDKICVKSDL